MRIIQSFIASFIIAFLFIEDASAKGSLLVQNARLIDGTGAGVRDGFSILVLNGRIAGIGKNVSMDGIPRLDVKGSYVLPGIIDGHVHLMSGPGPALQGYGQPLDARTWRATWGKNISKYLRGYLACGVTTVLDAGAPAFIIREIRNLLAKGGPGPRFLTLGEFITPPEGFISLKSVRPVSTREGVESKLDTMQSLGVTGVKVAIEKGFNPFFDLPRHSPEILDAIRLGAEKRKLRVFVHATCGEDFNTALDIKCRALMHTLTHRGYEQLSAAFIKRMARSHTFQVSTLSITDAELFSFEPGRFNEPLLKTVVPESELSAARFPGAGSIANRYLLMNELPWFLKIFSGILNDLLRTETNLTIDLEHSLKAIYDLHRAGVQIVMGSDTVYLPYAVYSLHGFTSLREIELLGEAGLSPREAIRASTVNPAVMVGLDREIGTVEVGKCADLVVLKDDPLKDLRAFRTVQWTVKDGNAKTPEEWMDR